jgi:hypothetical protein
MLGVNYPGRSPGLNQTFLEGMSFLFVRHVLLFYSLIKKLIGCFYEADARYYVFDLGISRHILRYTTIKRSGETHE